MTRRKAKTTVEPAVETTQAEPTQPRPVDDVGRELDGYGLPLAGPARRRVLEEMGKPDPNVKPEGWAPESAPVVTTPATPDPVVALGSSETEKRNG